MTHTIAENRCSAADPDLPSPSPTDSFTNNFSSELEGSPIFSSPSSSQRSKASATAHSRATILSPQLTPIPSLPDNPLRGYNSKQNLGAAANFAEEEKKTAEFSPQSQKTTHYMRRSIEIAQPAQLPAKFPSSALKFDGTSRTSSKTTLNLGIFFFLAGYLLFFDLRTHLSITLLALGVSLLIFCAISYFRSAGLLSFLSSEHRTLLTQYNLLELSQMSWENVHFLDLLSIFCFSLSETQLQTILNRLPNGIQRKLAQKGVISLLPSRIQPILMPAAAVPDNSALSGAQSSLSCPDNCGKLYFSQEIEQIPTEVAVEFPHCLIAKAIEFSPSTPYSALPSNFKALFDANLQQNVMKNVPQAIERINSELKQNLQREISAEINKLRPYRDYLVQLGPVCAAIVAIHAFSWPQTRRIGAKVARVGGEMGAIGLILAALAQFYMVYRENRRNNAMPALQGLKSDRRAQASAVVLLFWVVFMGKRYNVVKLVQMLTGNRAKLIR
jgi:hypothetical protein